MRSVSFKNLYFPPKYGVFVVCAYTFIFLINKTIERIKKMSFDIEITIDNICRACLSKDPALEVSSEVYEKLKICGGIDTEEFGNKPFPTKICHKCFINLEVSYEFRRVCQESDRKIKELLQNSVLDFDKDEDILGNLKVEFLAPKEEPDKINIKEEYIVNNSEISFNLNFDGTDPEEFIEHVHIEDQKREESKFNSVNKNLVKDFKKKEKLKFNPASIESNIKSKRKHRKLKNIKSEKVKNAGDALHMCEFCGISYVSKFSMENHMRLHSARLRFVCDICGDSYAGKFQLEQHMCSKHTGERNFKCSHCDKAFFSKTLRNKHQIRSHSKLFKCDQCDKSFGRSDSLKKHMRVHTGEKPIVCDKCGTRFKELHHLKNHKKSIHPAYLK